MPAAVNCRNCGEKNPPSAGNKQRIYCSKKCSNVFYRKEGRYYTSQAREGYGDAFRKAKRERQERKEDYEAAIAAGWINYLDLAEECGFRASTIYHRIRAALNDNDSRLVHDETPGASGWKRYISPEGVRKLAEYDKALKEEREAIEIRKLEAQRKREARQEIIEENKRIRETERERKRLIREQESKARAKAKAEEKERKRLAREEKKEQTKIRYGNYLKSPEWRAQIAAKRREQRKDPVVKLRTSIGVNVYHALKRHIVGSKGGKTFARFDFTPDELFEHLELRFDEHMTWENYGTYWSLDHIIPQSATPWDSVEHPNFKKSWALDNLQPLPRRENAVKGNIYEGKRHLYDGSERQILSAPYVPQNYPETKEE